VLKELEGFSHAEIAGMLGISVGASEVRLHRGMRALRRLLFPVP
jgi:DNA-directed RNA polymerase specialized sigma24 family protein